MSVVPYEYVPLASLSGDGTYNFYAVVIRFEKHKTSNDNYVLDMKLSDQSLCSGSDEQAWKAKAVHCCIYANDEETLPDIKTRGDIIRVNRGKCTLGGKGVKVVGRVGKGIAVYVWEETNGGSMQPRHTRGYKFNPQKSDISKVGSLRSWWHSLSYRDVDVHRLKDFRLNAYLNVIVRVLGVCRPRVMHGNPSCVVLIICDATKIMDKRKDLSCSRVDLTRETYDVINIDQELVNQLYEHIYHVFVYDEHRQSTVDLNPGDYVSLVNVHLYQPACKIGTLLPALVLHGGGIKYNRAIKKLDLEDRRVERIMNDIGVLLHGTSDSQKSEEEFGDDAVVSAVGPANPSVPPTDAAARPSDASEDFETPPPSPIRENKDNVQVVCEQVGAGLMNAGVKDQGAVSAVVEPSTSKLAEKPRIPRARKTIQSKRRKSEASKVASPVPKKTCLVKPAVRSSQEQNLPSEKGGETAAGAPSNASQSSDIFVLHDSRQAVAERSVNVLDDVNLEELDQLYSSLKIGDTVTVKGLTATAFLPKDDALQIIYVTCPNCAYKCTYDHFFAFFNEDISHYLCPHEPCKQKQVQAVITMQLYAFVQRFDKTDDYLISFGTKILERILRRVPETIAEIVKVDKNVVWKQVIKLSNSKWSIKATVREILGVKAFHVDHFAYDQ